ncbi:MAG TPA: tetratricopeptide repeat protein, partial [Isosphaeraceae bacterium]|nr:tetratricopeptide repeat protein [Isosphaeraceae bacterium]
MRQVREAKQAMKRGRKRRWRLLVVAGVAGMGLAGAAIWASMAPRSERWPDIQESIKEERWSEAEARLRRWVVRRPDDIQAWLTLAQVLVAREDEAHAFDALKQVPAGTVAWPLAQAMLGDIALHGHDAAAAERGLRSAANKDPKAVDPRRRLASLFSLEQRNDETREALRELYQLTRDPRDLAALVGLTLSDWDTRDIGPELKPFLDKTPEDPWLRRAWGLYALRLGRASEALPHLVEAAEWIDNDPIGRAALAECRMLLGAQEGLDDDLGPEPRRPDLRAQWWVMRGQVARIQGFADQALECLASAAAADPENRVAQYRLGQALVRIGDGSAAREHLARAEAIRQREAALKTALDLQLDGGHSAEACDRLGKLCQDAGLLVEARGWFEHALVLDPSRTSIKAALVKLPESFEATNSAPHRRSSRARTVATVLPKAPESLTPCFEDIGVSCGISFQYESGARGNLFLGDTMGGGVGLIDYDGDGWLDIYVVNGCKLPFDPANPPTPNRLFRNKGNGSFEDVTRRAGVAGRGFGMGC